VERASLDVEPLVGRLRFGRAQHGLLILLVSLVGVIAAIGYQASLIVGRQTQALNDQLQLVSGDMVSLERQVLTHAVIVDRWASGDVALEEVELNRSLVERQRRITANEAERDPDLAREIARLESNLALVDELVAQGRPQPGSASQRELTVAIDDMMRTVKRLYDLTEVQNFALVHSLEDGLQTLHMSEWVVAVLIVILVLALFASMRRMLRTNYQTASAVLRREQARYLAARAEQARVENRYREVFDEVSDVVFRVDHQSRWALLNGAWLTLSGRPVDETLGRRVGDVWHPADRDRVAGAFASLLDGAVVQINEEARLIRADGVELTVVITARAGIDEGDDQRPAEGARVYVAGTINDVTARARAQQLSAAQTEILEMVALDAPLQSVLARIIELFAPHAPGTELRFISQLEKANPEATGMLPLHDLSRGEAIGALEWTTPPELDGDRSVDSVLVHAAQLGTLAIDRQLAANRMVYQATHDALTGLPNRALLVERTGVAIDRAARNGTRLAMLFLDVDRFKVVNDSLGHEAGDDLLAELADRITSVVRGADTVARLGGDEFVVLLEGVITDAQVCDMAERILAVVAEPIDIGVYSSQLTISIGIVIGDGDSLVADLMKNADVAMYRAKQAGRATYAVFDDAMQRWAAHRHEAELALQGALGRGEMEVWYQPLVHLTSGQLKGYEALVRWRRPEVGIVPPGQFIDLVEELGMINQVGTWVLETAAFQLAEWQSEAPDLLLTVNVSGRELGRSDYVDDVASIIERSGVAADSLVLEITESVVLEDTRSVRDCLQGLKDLGLRLAIDDFGTGYSSLQYLRQLNVDILKIDRAFVSSTDAALQDPTIVASITDLGHAFGLEVVAEGIETEEQRQALIALGVDTGQGYHFGRPAPPAEHIEWQCPPVDMPQR
jgi:diguanylate cyclase (GGDEF)-like protein/PAS domain S-box-containing protein